MIRRLLVIIAAVLLVGGIAVIVLNRQNRPNANISNSNVSATNSLTNTAAETNVNSDQPTPASRTAVLTVSRQFSERFGSTSTDNPVGHLTAAESFASAALKQAFKRLAASPPSSSISVSIASRAYAFSMTSFDERLGQAEVLVTLQRTERQGNDKPVTYQQNLILQLLRQDGTWKVNAATFVPRS